uniref:Uncharacterized protein n=1 Tax=Vitis vinifera TaxID=29760 RepID=F6HSK7_VITVI
MTCIFYATPNAPKSRTIKELTSKHM